MALENYNNFVSRRNKEGMITYKNTYFICRTRAYLWLPYKRSAYNYKGCIILSVHWYWFSFPKEKYDHIHISKTQCFWVITFPLDVRVYQTGLNVSNGFKTSWKVLQRCGRLLSENSKTYNMVHTFNATGNALHIFSFCICAAEASTIFSFCTE